MTRSVEGLHSHIARILKRAPASKLPYLSFELRAKQLLELAAYDPAVSWLHIMVMVDLLFSLSHSQPIFFCWAGVESVLVCQGLRDLEARVSGIERRQGFKELVLSRPRFHFALFVYSYCQSHQSPTKLPF